MKILVDINDVLFERIMAVKAEGSVEDFIVLAVEQQIQHQNRHKALKRALELVSEATVGTSVDLSLIARRVCDEYKVHNYNTLRAQIRRAAVAASLITKNDEGHIHSRR